MSTFKKSNLLAPIAAFFGFFIMGIVGGAVIPFIQGLVNDSISFVAALSVIFISLSLILFLSFNLKKNVQ